jgi:predicted Zn-dependent protease
LRLFRLFLIAAAFSVSGLAAAQDYNLPSIGQPADRVLSPAEEERIGRQVVAQLRTHGLILDDPELEEYVGRIGWRLAEQTEHAPSGFKFFVIDDGHVNAFALPGGYIGVNAGLIMESESESELAGVMAHEIAHVTQRHIARQIEATQGLTWATAAAMLLAIIAGGGDPSVVQAAIALGMGNLQQQQINFTRQHELEADRLGIRTLVRAEYNPNGMSEFFRKMERRARLYGNRLPEILLTHPLSDTRIAEAESRIRDVRVTTIRESDEYPLMRARVRVLNSTQPSEAVTYFEEKRRHAGTSDPATDYGYALALSRVGRIERSHDLLAELASREASHPHFALAHARVLLDRGDRQKALRVLARVEPRHSSYPPINLVYAEALIVNGYAPDARRYLMNRRGLVQRNAGANRLLARAAEQENRLAEAHYREARYFFLRGNHAAAMHRLMAGLQLPDLSQNDEARLRATLREYREDCKEQFSERECRQRVEGTGSRRR